MVDLRFAEHLAAYVDVVRGGSFSSAARRREVSPSAIVRQIDALEKAFSVKLLMRSTRAVRPTDAGARLFERARRLLDDLADTQAEILATDGLVAGTLRIACAPSFAKRFIVPAIDRLVREHPQLSVDVDISERLAEPVLERLDAIIRVGELSDSSLIATKIAEQRRWLVASPAYLSAWGHPSSPTELRAHRLIDKLSGSDLLGWLDVLGDHLRPETDGHRVFRCNDFEAMRLAAQAGMGIAFLPDWLLHDSIEMGTLMRLAIDDEPWNAQTSGIYLLRALPQTSAKVRALIDSLRAVIAEDPWGCDPLKQMTFASQGMG
jgi:DNA-binding transcriptional LysR family regulator